MKIVNFVIEHFDTIISLILLLGSAVSTIALAIKTKNWNKIASFVKECVKEAEAFAHYTGEEKKAYVMTKANQYALSKKIKFNATKVSNLIEEVVALSKEVNQRDKDKTTVAK